MNSNFEPIKNDASVVSFKTGTFKLSDLNQVLQDFGKEKAYIIADHVAEKGKAKIPNSNLFNEGVEAELLEPGKSEWVKGRARLKFVLEFELGDFQDQDERKITPPTRLHHQGYHIDNIEYS